MSEKNCSGSLSHNKRYSSNYNDSIDSIEKQEISHSNIKKRSKKKVFFFLDSPDVHNGTKKYLFKRKKFTMEQKNFSCTADFAPKLKPIQAKLVPPKFYLNENNLDKKPKSCCCSDLEDSDDDEEEENEDITTENSNPSIKNIRKDLEKIKSFKIQKASSKQVLTSKDFESIGEKILFNEEGEDIFSEIEPFEDIAIKCEDINKSLKMIDNEEIGWNNVNKNEKTERKKINSLSIIDVLKGRNKN